MSMIGNLVAVTPVQIAAFRSRPTAASDCALALGEQDMNASLEATLASLPPEQAAEMRAQYENAREQLVASLSEERPDQVDRMNDAGRVLTELGPFSPVLDLYKSWHVLHYLFSGHADASDQVSDFLLNGERLGEDVGYGPPALHDPRATAAIAAFLTPLTVERILTRLDGPTMERAGIYPVFGPWRDEEHDAWSEDIGRLLPLLQAYVSLAAARGDGLLIWLT